MTTASERFLQSAIVALWDMGYSVVPRLRDPFEIPPSLIPGGWSYQWNTGQASGDWSPVMYEDHPGLFAPLGERIGAVQVGGLWLVKKKGDLAEQVRREQVKRSREQLESWADRFGMFTGGATMLQTDGEEVVRTDIVAGKGVEVRTESFARPTTKTIELVSKLPKDMIAHIDAVFEERDRIVGELVSSEGDYPRWREDAPEKYQPIAHAFWKAVGHDKGAPWWPTLHAIILPYAIDNVRQKLKEGAAS